MNANTETAATPAKLNTGAWGAKVQGSVTAGQALRITTRAGKSWTATVERVVWTDGRVSLVSTSGADRKPAAPRRSHARRAYTGRGHESCGQKCPVSGRRCTAADPCHDCR